MKKFHIALIVSLFALNSLDVNVANAVEKEEDSKEVINKSANDKDTKNTKNDENLVNRKLVKNENKNLKKKKGRFYGRARVGLGYEYQGYTGSFVKSLWNEFNYDGNKSNQAPVISLGYNMYYTLNKRFALLGGLEVQGRYPIKGKKFASDLSVQYAAQYGEYLRLNAKLGLKTDLTKDVAVEAYGIIGMNVATLRADQADLETHISKTNVGFTTGLGADLVIVDKFIVGLEYRYGANKFKNLGEGVNSFKMKTHSVLAKVGYQFG